LAEWIVYAIWFVTLLWILYQFLQGVASSGLLLCYWILLSMYHLFAHFTLSATPLPEFYALKQVSVSGFEVSGYAVLGLLVSLILYKMFVEQRRYPSNVLRLDGKALAHRIESMRHFGTTCMVFGLCLFFIGALGVYEYLPSSTSIASSSQLLVISGILMKWWVARMSPSQKNRGIRWLWLVLILIYPFYTILVQGFIGFGVTAVLVFSCFLWRRMKSKYLLILLAPVIVYAGLVTWITYSQIRAEVRTEIRENTSALSRFDVLYRGFFSNLSFIDLENPKQIATLDRLNQNILIGESVRYLEQGAGKTGDGETFIDATLALVPRVLWPGKPSFGGSGGLVTRYTGILFSEGTSVGIGQIMECYVNFGRWFVFGMFFAVGLILKFLDAAIEVAFIQFKSAQLLLYFIIGVSWLNVLGCFSETFPAIVGAVVMATITIVVHNATWPRHRV
jgi:hypothetical protein